MTFYLLVVIEGGEVSYSLWKDMSLATSEMHYLKRKFGLPLYRMDIIPIDAYD